MKVADHTTYGNGTSSGCDPILHDLSGHIVLLRRGGCEFGRKAMHAQDAGAVGLLVYCEPGEKPANINWERYRQVHIPVGSIGGDDGLRLIDQLANKTDMTIRFLEQLVDVPTAGLSSR